VICVYFYLIPANTFITFNRSNGGGITFSREGVSISKPPDQFATNGISHMDPYVERLLGSKAPMAFLMIFTPDGKRGFGLTSKEGRVEAGLVIDWRQEPERETNVRAFFAKIGVAPSTDYLAGNGGVNDATRLLSYPVKGNSKELTALAERILKELCNVSENDGLNITFREK